MTRILEPLCFSHRWWVVPEFCSRCFAADRCQARYEVRVKKGDKKGHRSLPVGHLLVLLQKRFDTYWEQEEEAVSYLFKDKGEPRVLVSVSLLTERVRVKASDYEHTFTTIETDDDARRIMKEVLHEDQ